jgi:hypothetical protein
MGLSFQVAEGGFLDIDVAITGPDGKVIYDGERETDGKYTFSAHMDGRYRYCFSNKMSSVTPKLVVFNLNIGNPKMEAANEDGKVDRVNTMVNELAESLYGIKREQDYMDVREKTHSSSEWTLSLLFLSSVFCVWREAEPYAILPQKPPQSSTIFPLPPPPRFLWSPV